MGFFAMSHYLCLNVKFTILNDFIEADNRKRELGFVTVQPQLDFASGAIGRSWTDRCSDRASFEASADGAPGGFGTDSNYVPWNT